MVKRSLLDKVDEKVVRVLQGYYFESVHLDIYESNNGQQFGIYSINGVQRRPLHITGLGESKIKKKLIRQYRSDERLEQIQKSS